MNKIASLFLGIFIASSVFAQTQTQTAAPSDPNHQIIELRVNAPAPQVVQSTAVDTTKAVTSEIVKGAEDLGAALGTGLRSLAYETRDITFGKDKTLVQGIDELSQTDAGRFTMAVIAWKVAGKDALGLMDRFAGVVIGIPILFVLLGIYVWVMRRFFIMRVVKIGETVTGEGKEKVRTIIYGAINADSSYSSKRGVEIVSTIDDDTRMGGTAIATIIYLIVSAVILAAVVF